MALTKIGATLGGSADIINITQTSHGFVSNDRGKAVRMNNNSGTPQYVLAIASATTTADAIGIIIHVTDGNNFTMATSGRITVDYCVPNEVAGTVLFLSHATAGVLTSTEPSAAGHVSKPMAVITIANSEMIMLQQRGEVISTGAVSIADGSVTLAKLAHTNNSNDGLFLRHNGSGSDPTWVAATTDTTAIENDIKQLLVTTGFLSLRVAALASLGDYNLGDLLIDDFQDATGIDASASTNEVLASGYYSGTVAGSGIDSYVKLMMHFDNNLTDSSTSNHTVANDDTAASDVTFSTSWVRPGSGSTHSADFGDGLQRKLRIPASADFNMEDDPFTIDFWIHFKGSGEIFGDYETFRVFIESDKLKFKGGGINTFFSSSTLSDNGDYHIAIQRGTAGNGANVRAWVNGSHWGSMTANTTDIGASNVPFYMGHGDSWVARYIDEFRLSKGVARYADSTANITVPTAAYTASTVQNMTLISNATTASSAPTKGDLLITYEDAAGAIALNTELKGYISRNNGTTFTPGTLVAEGTIGTQKVVAFHDLDISGQSGSGEVQMKYKIETLEQASNKETRIHGVAMGWS